MSIIFPLHGMVILTKLQSNMNKEGDLQCQMLQNLHQWMSTVRRHDPATKKNGFT